MKLTDKIAIALAVVFFAAAGVIAFRTATMDRPSLASEHKEVHPPTGPRPGTSPATSPATTGVRFVSQRTW